MEGAVCAPTVRSKIPVQSQHTRRRNLKPPRRGLWARGRGIGRPGSAPAGSQVVRIPGLQAGPLGGGTSIGTDILLAFKPLWPAGRRVLPRLLSPVDGQVEQPVAVIHRLDAAYRRPVNLEDIGAFSQVANEVHP